ncbi:PEP-CTERM sorting domain-containing protein, partial [Cephaloticoccus primus]|uniref:PEP-CTERM sorting domain-containing protein n=1 Tax=Cephaloticoccus primus TaxID=1548207 RepID=UPI0012E81313
PRGPEYGGAQAILQMGGNTKLSLSNLHIENRGTIDWVGGEVGRANILWIDMLTFSSSDAQLFIRNWYEYEDILLVKRANFNFATLPQIIFEGYQDYETTWKPYDNNYIQITPFGAVPEPTTYGALLGAAGIGLYLLRRRRRCRKSSRPALRGRRWRGATCH